MMLLPTMALVIMQPALHAVQPALSSCSQRRTRMLVERSDGGESTWEDMLARLTAYAERWGNADAPLGPTAEGELGRWCKVQRRLRSEGKLREGRVAALDGLGFSWVAPSD
eukprot:1676813-Prymnesium_polylepis.1